MVPSTADKQNQQNHNEEHSSSLTEEAKVLCVSQGSEILSQYSGDEIGAEGMRRFGGAKDNLPDWSERIT